MDKKSLIIILFAVILAALVTFFIFGNKKQLPIKEMVVEQEQQEQVLDIADVLPDVEEVNEEKQVVSPTNVIKPTPVVKKLDARATLPVAKETVKEEVTQQSTLPKEEVKEGAMLFQDKEGALVIPVGYGKPTESKYVYTPARFNKK